MDDGYDQAYEDRLFDAIDWPHAGYRLFEIGHFVGDRDWLDGVWESNCMFVAARAARAGRRLRRELLDGRRRLRQPRALRAARARRPTSPSRRSSARARSTRSTAARPPTSPTPPSAGPGCSATASTTPSCAAGRSGARASRSTTSAGSPSPAARRTKPRRLSAEMFAEGADAGDVDGRPEQPDAGARRARRGRSPRRCGGACRGTRTTWLGRRIDDRAHRPARLPGDHRRRSGPTGSSRPAPATAAGRCSSRRCASWSATARCCRSTRRRADDLPAPSAAALPRRPAARRGRRSTAVRDDRRRRPRRSSCSARAPTGSRRRAEFEAYAPLVPVGSYVVVPTRS